MHLSPDRGMSLVISTIYFLHITIAVCSSIVIIIDFKCYVTSNTRFIVEFHIRAAELPYQKYTKSCSGTEFSLSIDRTCGKVSVSPEMQY